MAYPFMVAFYSKEKAENLPFIEVVSNYHTVKACFFDQEDI